MAQSRCVDYLRYTSDINTNNFFTVSLLYLSDICIVEYSYFSDVFHIYPTKLKSHINDKTTFLKYEQERNSCKCFQFRVIDAFSYKVMLECFVCKAVITSAWNIVKKKLLSQYVLHETCNETWDINACTCNSNHIIVCRTRYYCQIFTFRLKL